MRNRTDNQVTLAFIRHGATKANEEHRYLGKTDEGLSKEGIRELLSYKKQCIYPRVECLFTSPMKRCLETAQILYPNLSPTVIAEWEETDFGQFEYKNYEDLKDNPAYQAWIGSGGMHPFPDGESREEFLMRCERGFAKMCGKLRGKKALTVNISEMTDISVETDVSEATDIPITVGMIVHGGTIMALLSKYCGNDYYDYQVRNGCGFICRMKEWKDEMQIINVQKLEFLRGITSSDLQDKERE